MLCYLLSCPPLPHMLLLVVVVKSACLGIFLSKQNQKSLPNLYNLLWDFSADCPLLPTLPTLTWATIRCSSPFENIFSLHFSKMSVFSASPQCFSLAHYGEIFQVPLFHFWLLYAMGFSFMPFTPALVFKHFFFRLDFWGKEFYLIMVFLLLPARPQLSDAFHHFKVIALRLVHFSLVSPVS